MSKELFSLPIAPVGPYPGGAITATEPSPQVYLLTFTSPPDNRITTPFCKTLLQALDLLEFGGYKPGVVVTTSGIGKFYSNGLDLEHAVGTPGFWPLLYSVWARFLTFSMPTIAWLNGHTYAGGLMLAISHDYRLAPSPRGFICLNELLFGSPLKPAMAALFRPKVSPTTYRTLVLEAHRFNATDALEAGLVDAIAEQGFADVLKLIETRGLREKAKTGVYGLLKAEMYRDLVEGYLVGPAVEREGNTFAELGKREDERKEFGRVWFEAWQKDNAKAKL